MVWHGTSTPFGVFEASWAEVYPRRASSAAGFFITPLNIEEAGYARGPET